MVRYGDVFLRVLDVGAFWMKKMFEVAIVMAETFVRKQCWLWLPILVRKERLWWQLRW